MHLQNTVAWDKHLHLKRNGKVASAQSQTKPQQWKHWVQNLHVWHLGNTLAGCRTLRTWAASPWWTYLLQHLLIVTLLGWLDSLRLLSGGLAHFCFHEVSGIVLASSQLHASPVRRCSKGLFPCNRLPGRRDLPRNPGASTDYHVTGFTLFKINSMWMMPRSVSKTAHAFRGAISLAARSSKECIP